MNSKFLFRLLMLAVSLLVGAAIVHAEDLGAVKARMEQRVGSIDALKDRKAVGENNQGFLEVRGAVNPSEQQVVSAENDDRRTVYAAIAGQTGTSADAVGRRRAQQIATASKPGVLIQAADGSWSEKH